MNHDHSSKHLHKRSFINFTIYEIRQELSSWKDLVRNEWPLALVLCILILTLIFYAKPFPPKVVSIAAGQVDTSLDLMATRYAEFFKRHGVTLKIVHTIGTGENLDKLIEKNEIKSALLIAGSVQKNQHPKLESLGSVQQIPFWLFYRGKPYEGDDPFSHFSHMRVSIGASGSGTQHLLRELMTMHIPLEEKPKNLFEYSHPVAAQKLINGEIDAMVILDGYTSPIIQHLLNTPGINLYSFKMAPAYEKKLPYLEMVTIPRGSLDLKSMHPPSDIKMISSSLMLLVEKDLHPAIQLLFLMAADEFGDARDQFFSRPDEFPSYKDHNVPLSPTAKTYLTSGPSIFTHFFPYWIANFIDRMWLLIIAIVTVAFPLFKMLPNYRHTRTRIEIGTAYQDLRQIELNLITVNTKEGYEEILAELDALETAISELTVPAANLNQYYSLCSSLNMVRKNAVDRLNRLMSGNK